MTKIFDCRRKEILITRRVGGDFELSFVDSQTGAKMYVAWFEMKKPWMKSCRELEALFDKMKIHLEDQELMRKR